MIKLYESPISPYARKVKMVLLEKNVAFETAHIDILAEEQKTAAYRAMNPFHRVPVLCDGDAVLFESTAINEYLEEKFPEPPLLPSDPVARAHARAWEEVADAYFGASIGAIVQETFVRAGGPDLAIIDQHKATVAEHLSALDQQLEGKDFVVGTYSLADIGLAIQVSAIPMLGISLDSCRNVGRWLEKMQARESFSKAAPTPAIIADFISRVQIGRNQ